MVYTPRADMGRGHGDLRFWGTLGGCGVVARRVDHQRAPAACTTERYVLQGKRSKRSRVALNVSSLLFPRHHVVLGADLNVNLNGFEDGRFVGDATVPLTKARSCADGERASALYEFMLNFGLRADNTWSEWDCVTRVGGRHESRESQVSLQRKRRFLMFGSTHRWCVTAIIWQWLARIRQIVVFWVRARSNEFPALFDGQRMIPWHERKLLVALESLVLTGETRWLFLVSWRALQMLPRHVENARRIRSSAI